MNVLRRAWPRRVGACAAALVLGLLAVSAHAQWKWRDKDGRVNASDLPPPRDVPDKDILSRPVVVVQRAAAAAASAASAAASEAPAAKTGLEREVEARKRAAEQEQAAKAKADDARVAAVRAENCQRARAQLGALDSGQRMVRVNAQGERTVLDDAGRAEELRQVRDVIASDCR